MRLVNRVRMVRIGLLALVCGLVPIAAAAQGAQPVVIVDPVTQDAARVSAAGVLSTTAGGGGGGTVTQGPNNGSVLTSAAWSTRVIFGDAVIDPRLVTIQNATLAATQSGVWTIRVFDQNGVGINSTANALHVNLQNASIAVTGGFLTDAQLRATPVPVSGTFFQATQPVSATDLDIRDLTFAADKADVSGSAVTAVVTATNLDVRDLTFAQDKVDVSGSAIATTPPAATTASGTLDALNETLAIATPNGGVVGVQIVGTIPDGDMIIFERTVESVEWSPIIARRCSPGECVGGDSEVAQSVWTWTDGIDEFPQAFTINAGGSTSVRVRTLSATGSIDVDLLLQPLATTDMTHVRGQVAVSGAVFINGTVPISATDLDVRNLVFATDKVDVSGSSVTATVTSGNITANPSISGVINVSLAESVAAPTAATWYLKRRWQPTNTTIFQPTRVWSTVTTAGSRTVVSFAQSMGTFNVSTNVFTDGNNAFAPILHYSRLFACVDTVLSAAATTVTVTYTDENGVGGNATVGLVIPASAPVGNCFEFVLAATTGQERDAGIKDITAVADTAAPTGVIRFWAMNVLHDALGVANAYEQTTYDAGQLLPNTNNNESVLILFQQAATTAQQRGAGITGSVR